MPETSENAFQEKMEELKTSDPLYHDLLLAFNQFSQGSMLQQHAVGRIVDLVALSRALERKDGES